MKASIKGGNKEDIIESYFINLKEDKYNYYLYISNFILNNTLYYYIPSSYILYLSKSLTTINNINNKSII